MFSQEVELSFLLYQTETNPHLPITHNRALFPIPLHPLPLTLRPTPSGVPKGGRGAMTLVCMSISQRLKKSCLDSSLASVLIGYNHFLSGLNTQVYWNFSAFRVIGLFHDLRNWIGLDSVGKTNV